MWGGCGLGRPAGWVRVRSLRGGSRKNFSNCCGVSRLKFYRAGADKEFQPVQDSSAVCNGTSKIFCCRLLVGKPFLLANIIQHIKSLN